MVWGAFSWHGIGPIYKINTEMDQHVYKSILTDTLILFAEDNMSLIWKFMQDNDLKRSLRLVKSCLEKNNITVLKWPAQFPNLNPVEKHVPCTNSKSNKLKRFVERNPKYKYISKLSCLKFIATTVYIMS